MLCKTCFSPSLCVFHPIWVLGVGGAPKGAGHNLLVQFSGLGSSKMEIYETDLFDTMTIQNDEMSYVKHVLAPLYVFFTLFGGGGLTKGLGHNLLNIAKLVVEHQGTFSDVPLVRMGDGFVDYVLSSVKRYLLIVLCGLLKRPMGTYGGLWGPMGAFGDLSEPMGTYGDPRGAMGTYGGRGHLWGPMGTYGGLWGRMRTYGDLWGPRSPQAPIGAHRFP